MFATLYYKAQKQSYRKKGVNYDSINTFKDLSYYFYGNYKSINHTFLQDDPNRDKLYNKWLNDKLYIPLIEKSKDLPEGSFDLVRCLDFYNSKEVKKYIDSLRDIEYQRYIDKNK